jgi:two-component system LytT family response regulator
MKALLIDDEIKSLNALQLMLQHYCPQVTILALCDTTDDALEKVKTMQPDLLFLDISMPKKNGFELLEAVGKVDLEVIFVTAHDTYMLKAFKFSAVDYLLKPVLEDELINAVNRAIERIQQKNKTPGIETFLHNLKIFRHPEEAKLRIATQQGFEVVSLQDIVFCEAESSYTVFHLLDKKQIVSSKTIKEYEYLLLDSFFVRVHKSHLINMKHVKKYHRGEGGTVIMTGELEIKVAKRKKDLLLQKINEYFKY